MIVTAPTGRRPTSDDRYWASKALQLDRSGLTVVREAAEKWRGGLAGLAALVAGGWAVGAPFVSQNLDNAGSRVVVGACAAISAVAFTVAAWCAMRASFGYPKSIDNSGGALKRWTEDETLLSLSLLARARVLTGVGLAALFLAGLSIYLTSAAHKPPPAPTLVRLSGDRAFCGVVSWGKDGIELTVRADDGTVHPLRTSDVVALVPGGC